MSALSSGLADYLALRRGFGYKLAAAGPVLWRFVAHQDSLDIEILTVASALSWATETGRNSGVGRRLVAIRGFARYMQAIDTRHEVPPVGLAPVRRHRAVPHIYTEDTWWHR